MTDYAAILAGIPQPYLVLDTDLTIVAATDAYLETTDSRRADIVGRHILQAFPENPSESGAAEQGPLEVSLRHVLSTGEPHEMAVIQYDLPQAGGGFEQRFWTPSHSPVKAEDGSVRYIIQNPMDVTASVLESREADARLRVALHAADLGSWEYEPETDIWRRSAAVDEIFGFEPGEGGPVAAPFFARIHPDDIDGVMKTVADAFEHADQTLIRFDYRIVDPVSGSVRYVVSRGEVLRTASGKARLIGVMMDVTTDRLREEALGKAVAAQQDLLVQKDLLLAEVNHRVKNSLQLVVSALSLQARRLSEPAIKSAFEQAISRVRAITSVHERLYKTDNPLVVDMADYLNGLCAELAEHSELRDLVRIDVDQIRVRTERAIPIALIVNELITNALKYAYPEGTSGPITLSLKALPDEMIELSVADEGVGAASATTAQGLGTRLVQAMSAQIEGHVEVTDAGRGYRTRVVFPAGDAK
ncbi:histidine kinase dimerization/phosphoacceptor domain -containing protein [Fulvimarina sp. 2208YS6-2-32]|uniref:histidine kinase n=1 Tax=Fulvimarina uroteuthidis TaxID=3098149 RepID=A0ABU5I4D7_9HYPH|nr:histidine kinase dimerization/phosphoacceptor domain -containing protein [Fulvimarina sp. 2208YS6-2-32]MDY8110227.1 histidine kinase dimerization/phosphoacceptor domain -containing protein [Fulvimarina sp. 2208YS6-2-32]